MKKNISLCPILLLVFFGLSFSALQAQETTTFILIRHAEKVDDGTKDPELSTEGEQRAERLAHHLKETDITAIYSTPYKRTQGTVQGIARQKELQIKEYDPFNPNAVDLILEKEYGGTVLISGHSNTTPDLVNQLIGQELFAQLDESDYDNLFIVTAAEKGKGKVIHLTY